MKQAIKKLVLVFMLYTLLSVVQRAFFIAFYAHLAEGARASQWLATFLHGLPLDFSIAGYLSAVPSLLILAQLAGAGKWERVVEKVYYGAIALIISAVYILDIVLYSYWGTRLDFSPLFYFSTSPSAAFASAEWWQTVVGTVAWIAVASGIFVLFRKIEIPIRIESKRKVLDSLLMLLVTACLFIPIRGSFTVAPVNMSQAYFCDNQRVNQAAVNPAFSLFYSLAHQNNFDRQFRFMDPRDAEAVHEELYTEEKTDTVESLLQAGPHPDIYIVLLESFSKALFPTLGGEDVASGLDSIARSGLSFTNIFASGFRTDRAIPAVISGFPAQPTVSLMKYVEKAAKLPALPNELAKLGYESTYYYGGDADFTNMRAYLVNSGFKKIISDKDFSLKDRLSKWGAPDHLVFERALREIREDKSGKPRFAVIQTSSSHEPFDVPYHSPRFADNNRLNAFAYVDSCATAFVNALKDNGKADNALIIFVADHYGAWPENAEGLDRFHIPLIMTGGALAHRGEVPETGSQTDIAATLLNALGLDSDSFRFSRNLLAPSARHFAFFAGNGSYGYINDTDTIIYDCNSAKPTFTGGQNTADAEHMVKGALQYLYQTISNL